jgi:DNA-directed RNA polymerase subunit M/transcription elongation factor TFIIS
MKGAKFQSKCPECGNIDILNDYETQNIVHCQRCYHHYDYKINDIKNRIFKDSEGISDYTSVFIEEMDWLVKQAEMTDSLIQIALWSIRRLPTEGLKQYALIDLDKTVGTDHKYSEFIKKCMDEVIPPSE